MWPSFSMVPAVALAKLVSKSRSKRGLALIGKNRSPTLAKEDREWVFTCTIVSSEQMMGCTRKTEHNGSREMVLLEFEKDKRMRKEEGRSFEYIDRKLRPKYPIV